MSLGILRSYIFNVQGDGVGNVLTIDLREQTESKDTIGQGSPLNIQSIAVTASPPVPAAPAISFATIENFILTITFAAPLFVATGSFELAVTFMCPGAV